ncbi:uncharacterized protein LOC109841378 [Asparagus officinalis]|uniref:uncharacterized protein LOC109841378 n=1 Tax=Asparagus officinalis TaxID=4686 RepID=UPI00098E1525|nr:uncharacterized protein LOC109841378 [Asparagus officinalis]XP_020265904.1 uncharacterized protein LOC109841378 [Asparagus officinalis]XP_020265905.1 uncharacterized protein LOC109841378 [Asparagus officinalis]
MTKGLVARQEWYTLKASAKNKESRNSQTLLHTAGSKSFARIRRDMVIMMFKKQKDVLFPALQETGENVIWTSRLIFGKGERSLRYAEDFQLLKEKTAKLEEQYGHPKNSFLQSRHPPRAFSSAEGRTN